MNISIITLFPKMVSQYFDNSIVKRAQDKKLVEIKIINLRDFAIDNYGTVDDKPYGGGVGMVLRVDVIHKALSKAKNQTSAFTLAGKQNLKVLLTSPKGKKFDQKKAQEYSQLDNLIIIAGHYEDIDARVLNYINEEVSMGDFIMTGGEISASAIVDSVVRLLPGVLKKDEATKIESFFDIPIDRIIEVVGENENLKEIKNKGIKTVKLLEYPQYTRPEIFNNKKVPDVLLSGNHKNIENWQIKMAYEETIKKRPDLLDKNI